MNYTHMHLASIRWRSASSSTLSLQVFFDIEIDGKSEGTLSAQHSAQLFPNGEEPSQMIESACGCAEDG